MSRIRVLRLVGSDLVKWAIWVGLVLFVVSS